MRMRLSLTCCLLGLTLSLLLARIGDAQENAAPPGTTYRVMSFNIRFGTADDGENSWDQRKDLVLETIEQFSPDLFGTQETQKMQATFLQEHLDEYQYIGKSRVPDDDETGEQCAIFFRRDRFVDLEQGHIWLSETPQVPASKSWDSSLPRMASWVRLFDRKNSQIIFFLNTHFDHRGKIAREQSAVILRDQIAKLSAGPTIVTGDFNASDQSKPYTILVDDQASLRLFDTWRVFRPARQENEGTFNGFQGNRSGPRIDWILASSDFTVGEAEIVTHHRNGRYPSDHFPVSAVLSLP